MRVTDTSDGPLTDITRDDLRAMDMDYLRRLLRFRHDHFHGSYGRTFSHCEARLVIGRLRRRG